MLTANNKVFKNKAASIKDREKNLICQRFILMVGFLFLFIPLPQKTGSIGVIASRRHL
tara:strand:- start:8 stop:181 length:174 start_codon:yes stop_codon:yes gene_type:complete